MLEMLFRREYKHLSRPPSSNIFGEICSWSPCSPHSPALSGHLVPSYSLCFSLGLCLHHYWSQTKTSGSLFFTLVSGDRWLGGTGGGWALCLVNHSPGILKIHWEYMVVVGGRFWGGTAQLYQWGLGLATVMQYNSAYKPRLPSY